MLKADLHLHSGEDRTHHLKYSARKLIGEMAKQGFEVLALTLHKDVFYDKKVFDYAKKKGVLLIQGTEKFVEKKEVLIYNITQKEADEIKTFDDLRKLKKKKDILVIAPHPYFLLGECLGKKLEENIDVFDAVEYSHFYLSWLNLNRKAVRISKKYKVPMIGNSDIHHLKQIGMTYSLIDSKKDMKSVFNAVRKRKVTIKTKPASLYYFVWKAFMTFFKLE
ncbi:PHP-associated domain-containing protein [Bacteroidota bacterium]